VPQINTALRSLIETYRASTLLQNPQARDMTQGGVAAYGKAPGTRQRKAGKQGEKGRIQSFGGDLPMCVRFEQWLIGAAAFWRYELDRERLGVERAELPAELVELAASLNGIASNRDGETARKGGKPSASKRAEDRQLLATTGDAIVVGLLFGRTSEAVRKLRERNDQDPHTGERLHSERPLTSRRLPDAV
jgi:hypothetical protein